MAARLELSTPAPTDRERVWSAIRELACSGKVFTRLDLALKTRLSRQDSAINEYLKGLERAGFIRVVSEQKRGTSNLYELARDVGVDAPRVNKERGGPHF